MNNDFNNILPNDDQKKQGLNALNEELFSYEDSFENDAEEGLQQLPTAQINTAIEKLNADLHKKLKKNKRKSRALPSQQNTYFTIITILLLAIITYVVIKKFIG
jgi:hypothetical protein